MEGKLAVAAAAAFYAHLPCASAKPVTSVEEAAEPLESDVYAEAIEFSTVLDPSLNSNFVLPVVNARAERSSPTTAADQLLGDLHQNTSADNFATSTLHAASALILIALCVLALSMWTRRRRDARVGRPSSLTRRSSATHTRHSSPRASNAGLSLSGSASWPDLTKP